MPLSTSRTVLIAATLLAGGGIATAVLHRQASTPPAAAAAAADPLAALEAATKAKPDDPARWVALGQFQYEGGHYAEAAAAYEQAVKHDSTAAGLWSALGEARVMASEHDPMPAAAQEAFARAHALDPKDPRARYFLAVKRDLAGDHQGAIDDWLALLGDSPPGAPWEADLKRTIAQVGKINKIAVDGRLAAVKQPAGGTPAEAVAGEMPMPALAGIPGPSADQLRAAGSIPPSQQQGMVAGMVAKLEGRLKENPANPDGWAMLMRSRMTLGEGDKAAAALKAGMAANPAAAASLRAQAKALGVPGA